MVDCRLKQWDKYILGLKPEFFLNADPATQAEEQKFEVWSRN